MAKARRFYPIALIVLLCAPTGCGSPAIATEGIDMRASFSYVSSCVFGCAIDHAMMTGTSEDISVRPKPGGTLPGLNAVTDDPSVVSLESTGRSCVTSTPSEIRYDPGALATPCSPADTGYVTVSARTPGTTTLRLFHLDGSLFDHVLLEVAAQARVGVECNTSVTVSSISMTVGQTCGLTPVAFDASGTPLQASQGIQLTILDPSVVRSNGLQSGSTLQLMAVGAGNTRILASAGAVSAQVPVHVDQARR
ncbi:MAG TPA: hypothetical protein VGY54_15395 [Polyangiaceae bacterium]|jgi:hypothetical protein|nr:hypothetical protein [Polyangiaceae bacterium]